MDFNKFQQWCQNRGFVVKLPSGYSKLINLEVSSFESFKGIFNLCMIFFYEELYKQREEEKKETLKKFVENFKDSPTILYPADDDGSNPYIYYKKNGESFVKKMYEVKDSELNHSNSANSSSSNWCDLGKESREKEYKNSELKHLVDRVADKYDSEDSASSYDDAD